jgi:hypothetical protein
VSPPSCLFSTLDLFGQRKTENEEAAYQFQRAGIELMVGQKRQRTSQPAAMLTMALAWNP